jgi:hypothetical protein
MWGKETMTEKSSASELRKFGVIMSICLAALGGLFLWRDKSYYWCFFAISTWFLFFGLALPAVLRPINRVWMTLSLIMGWFMSRLILIILFYLVLTPTAALLRMFGKDILNINFTRNSTESYWIPRKTGHSEKGDYERQY